MSFEKILLLLCLVALVSCARFSSYEFSRDITISSDHDGSIGIEQVRLLSISQDGTTTIEVLSTGQHLRAKPGDYFVCELFGPSGVQLLSASPGKDEAVLKHRWADDK